MNFQETAYEPLQALHDSSNDDATPSATSLQDLSTSTSKFFAVNDAKYHQYPPQEKRMLEIFDPKTFQHGYSTKRKILDHAKVAIFPIVAFGYVLFCLMVHFKHVIVYADESKLRKYNSIIKGGITSLSIILITIGMIPVKNQLSLLKEEEFFRALKRQPEGLPLSRINQISTPSAGILDSLKSIRGNSASYYLPWVVVSALAIVGISTLAPAALSVNFVSFESDPIALRVGAIKEDSVWNNSEIISFGVFMLSNILEDASSIGWAETMINVTVSFQVTNDSSNFIIPTPVDFDTSTEARWVSDVISISPQCNWTAPSSMQFQNTSIFGPEYVGVLPGTQVQVSIDASNLNSTDALNGPWAFDLLPPEDKVVNATSGNPVTDGSVVWELSHCITSQCTTSKSSGVDLDASSLPSVPLAVPGTADPVMNVYFLHCRPGMNVETHILSNNGNSRIAVEKTSIDPPQGNLLYTQTMLLLSQIFRALGNDGVSPRSSGTIASFGPIAQAAMLFGPNLAKNLSATEPSGFNPNVAASVFTSLRPVNEITNAYALMLRSLTKRALDGSLATSYVPGRTTKRVALLAVSLPHIITSTVLMILLGVFSILTHFRERVASFTFVDVAAALQNSDVPARLAAEAGDNGIKAKELEKQVLFVTERKAFDSSEDVGPVLALR